MIIGVCGLGYTGSGAVIDLLKEYKGVVVKDNEEFSLSYTPDGLEDLAYNLMQNCSRFMSSDASIIRFRECVLNLFGKRSLWNKKERELVIKRTDEFIEEITQVKWKGFWSFPKKISLSKRLWQYHFLKRYNKVYNRITGKQKLFPPNREMRLSIKPENFYQLAKNYVSDLIKILGLDGDKIVFNQPFAGNNPEKSFVFFNEPKAIVVDKDPRDLYLLCREEVFYDATWTPIERVEDFVKYYDVMRKDIDKNVENVLNIRFEDLIYEYDKTVKSIEQFLGLKEEDHVDKFKYFNPKISENNTQLFRKHLKRSKDIEQIENCLSKYLYPYENYKEKTDFGKSF